MNWGEFYNIYDSLKGERLERYNQCEEIWKELHGEYFYDDFRKFQARMRLDRGKREPHFSTANQR